MSELRDQHKAFAKWFLQQNPVAPNAEYLAWVAWKAALSASSGAEPVAWQVRWIDPEEGHGDWVPTRDPDFYRSRPTYEMRPLYAHPPRNEWRKAVLGALEICMILNEANRDDPERAMSDLMGWEPRDEWQPASGPPDSDRDVQAWIKIDLSELDGVVTEQCDAQAFYEDGAWHVRGPDHDGWMQLCPGHMVSVVVWRDVTPPTTEGE